MATRIAVTPLYGARDRGPKCTLLEVGGVRLLLDCGWSDALLDEHDSGANTNTSLTTTAADASSSSSPTSSSSPSLARAVKAARTAHVLLLSHADLDHLGALAAVAKSLPRSSKILATVPTHRLGQLALYDSALSRERAGAVPLPGCELMLLAVEEKEKGQGKDAAGEEEEKEEEMEEKADEEGEEQQDGEKKKGKALRPKTPPLSPPRASTAAQRRRAAVEAIDAAFSRVVALKFRQSFQLAVCGGDDEEEEEPEAGAEEVEHDKKNGDDGNDDDGSEGNRKRFSSSSSLPLESITLTPHCAGHTLGGCLWEIVPPGGDTLLYAPAVNHRRERHLDAAALPGFARPALLIAGAGVPPLPLSFQQQKQAGGAEQQGGVAGSEAAAAAAALSSTSAPRDPPPGEREADLIEACLRALRREGSVLIPAPTAGRATEVLLALDAAWAANRYPYPLALASGVAVSTLEFTRSLVEWMGEGITSQGGGTDQGGAGAGAAAAGGNRFQQQQQQQQQDHAASLRAIRPCHSIGDVARLPRGPKVVVASLASLDAGVARELLVEWAGNPNFAVVFPGQPPRGSLAARLVEGSLRQQGRQQFLAQQAHGLQQQMQGLQQQMQYNRGGQTQQQQQHYYYLQQQLGQLQQQMQQLSVDLSVSLAHHVPLEGPELTSWLEANDKTEKKAKDGAEGGKEGGEKEKGKTKAARASSPSGPTRTSVSSIGGAAAAVAATAVTGSATGPAGEMAVVPDAEALEMRAVGADAAPGDDPSTALPAAAVPASDVLIDGFAVPDDAAAPMFPEDVDDPDATGDKESNLLGPRSWDEYGAEARLGDVAASGTEASAGAAGAKTAADFDLDLPGGGGGGFGGEGGPLDDLATDSTGALALALEGVSRLGRSAIAAGFGVPEGAAAVAAGGAGGGGFGGRFPPPHAAAAAGAPAAATSAGAATAVARLAIPTRLSTSTARLRVRASVHVAAFDGLADARALRNMIAAVAPRHLVLLGAPAGDEHGSDERATAVAATTGTTETTTATKAPGPLRALADAAASDLARERARVHTPRDGETADASEGAASRRVALTSAALASVFLRPAGDVAVGWLDGVYAAPDVPGGALRIVPAEAAEEEQGTVVPDAAATAAAEDDEESRRLGRHHRAGGGRLVVPLSSAAAALLPPPRSSSSSNNEDAGGAFIGDVRLSDLRLALGAAGVRSAFSGGALICGRAKIVVARAAAAAAAGAAGAVGAPAAAADGEILVEGPLCEEYYRVRDVVYGQYTAS